GERRGVVREAAVLVGDAPVDREAGRTVRQETSGDGGRGGTAPVDVAGAGEIAVVVEVETVGEASRYVGVGMDLVGEADGGRVALDDRTTAHEVGRGVDVGGGQGGRGKVAAAAAGRPQAHQVAAIVIGREGEVGAVAGGQRRGGPQRGGGRDPGRGCRPPPRRDPAGVAAGRAIEGDAARPFVKAIVADQPRL